MNMLIDLRVVRLQLEMLQVCSALVQKVATALTVLTGGGDGSVGGGFISPQRAERADLSG